MLPIQLMVFDMAGATVTDEHIRIITGVGGMTSSAGYAEATIRAMVAG